MKRVFLLLTITLLAGGWTFQSENPFIGTWKCTKIERYQRNFEVIDTSLVTFQSEITFFKNYTYLRTTNSAEHHGTYELLKKNKMRMSEESFLGFDDFTWTMRWPKDKFDPHIFTSEIDFTFPVMMDVRTENGLETEADVDVIYTKLD
jgi:hypothetical protein